MNSFKKYLDELREIDEEYKEIMNLVNINPVNTTNGLKERKKFFKALKKGEKYNPQLNFVKRRISAKNIKRLEELKEKIQKQKDPYKIKSMYLERIEERIIKAYMINHWGTSKSGQYLEKVMGTPSKLYLLKAILYCKLNKNFKDKTKRLTAEEVGKRLNQDVLRVMNKKIKIRYGEFAARLKINGSKEILYLNKYAKFTEDDLRRLKIHEIGVHFLRYFNGFKTNLSIFYGGSYNYSLIEEGLAVYMEDFLTKKKISKMYTYAGRFIASYYCRKKSFYEVFKILKKYDFTNDEAYNMTYRVKRNMKDTSQKGGYVKDFIYFYGYHIVKKYLRTNKKEKLKELMCGKIKIKDVIASRKFRNKLDQEVLLYKPEE